MGKGYYIRCHHKEDDHMLVYSLVQPSVLCKLCGCLFVYGTV